MNEYTVRELKKQLEDMPDDMVVCIERIEDVYFESHGWTTEIHDFIPDKPGMERVEYMEAFGVARLKKKNKFVIVAHY